MAKSKGRNQIDYCITIAILVCFFFLSAFLISCSTVTNLYIGKAPVSTILIDSCVEGTSLRFTTDGTFQLSIFEDLHYGEAEDSVWGPQQDINSTRVVNTILDIEPPQLVILNGDLITGENTYLHNSTGYVDEIVKPLLERNLPWASSYGNHDNEFNLSSSKILAREHTWPNALTKQMVDTPTSGVSNYFLPVYSNDRHCDSPELIIWFFDSQGGNTYQRLKDGSQVPRQDWVDQSVVEWFIETNGKMENHYGKTIPSIAFVHIPVNAMLAFQQGPGVRPQYEPGINDDNPLAQQAQGSDDGSYGGQDIPFMQAMLETKGLMATFSGHDHGDDWCFRWDTRLPGMNITGNGLDLCFGRHSGYGGYGTWTRGSRQILITLEGLKRREVETWVRLETGDVTGKVTLNGTYGQDGYPVVPDTTT